MDESYPVADQLTALLESAVDAIITINASGVIQSVNPATEKLFGYTRAQLVGKNVNVLMPDPWSKDHDAYIQNYMETGKKRIIGIGREVEGKKQDGSIFPMHLAVSEYTFDGKRFFTGIIHDLTRRKRAEEALQRSQRLESVGKLTGGIAHDFNNILTIITGNLELLEMRITDEAQKELISEALEGAELGAVLTNRLLAFARRSVLEPQIVNLNQLIKNITSMLSRTLGEHITLQLSLDTDLKSALVDPGQVESAIVNLAINARDAMQEGGRLLVETKNVIIDEEYSLHEYGLETGPYIRISVSDTGVGMPETVHERAFEPFFTTKEVGNGTGLGLSMVYGFAKQSGGHVAIYSEVGVGTTVNIYLPQADEGPKALTNDTNASIEQLPMGNGERILVVEDDERVRDITVRRLQTLNYQIIEAESGEKALEILDREKDIQLVFTDLVMPGSVSGYDLANRIRSDYPNIRVLITSGYAADLLQAGELAEKALSLLRKPYRQADLARAIRVTLA